MSNQAGILNGLPMAQVNRIVSDGMGGITGNGTVVVNGVVTDPAHYSNVYRQLRLHRYTDLGAGGLIPELRHQGRWEPSLLHRDG